MRYAQTIAMATDLLASGRGDDVARMVEPLLDADPALAAGDGGPAPEGSALTDGAVRLQCLAACIDIVHYGRPAKALDRLSWLESADRTSLGPTARADVALWLGWSHAFQHTSADEEARALSLFDEALSIYTEHHNIRGRCWTRLGQARAYFALDEYHLMRRALDEAASLLDTFEDSLATLWLHDLRVPALRFEGRYDEAREHIDALDATGTRWDDRRILGHAAAYRAALRYDLGEDPDGIREQASCAERLLSPPSQVSQYPLLAAYHAHVGACLRTDRLDEAAAIVDNAQPSFDGYPVGEAHLKTLRARIALQRNATDERDAADEAEALLQDLFEQAHHLPHGLHRSHVALLRAELLRRRGNLEKAETWSQRALRNARETGHRGHQLRALCTRASLLVETGEVVEARHVIDAMNAYGDYDTVLPYVLLRASVEAEYARAVEDHLDARIALRVGRSAASIIRDERALARLTAQLQSLEDARPQTTDHTPGASTSNNEPTQRNVAEAPASYRETADDFDDVIGTLLAQASRSAALVAETWIQAVKAFFSGRWIGLYERRASGELRRLHASDTDPDTFADPATTSTDKEDWAIDWHPLTGTTATACFFGVERLPAERTPAERTPAEQLPPSEEISDLNTDIDRESHSRIIASGEDRAADNAGRMQDPALRRVRPWLPVVALALEHANERARSNRWNALRAGAEIPVEGFVAESAAMRGVAQQIRRIQTSHSPVLVSGERGTDLPLIAQTIHETSGRTQAPYREVPCGSMQRDPIEARLFGDARGEAFEPGAFQSADGGTLVLKDVDALPQSAQDRLIRVIEGGNVIPVGAATGVPADVRVIATTSADLREEIREGRFREDLFLHLNVIPIRVPPLRDRKEDIPLLVRHFTRILRRNGTPSVSVTHEAMEALLAYDWPGNVRQLRNEIERLLLLVHTEPAPLIEKRLLAEPIRETDLSVSDGGNRPWQRPRSTTTYADVPGTETVLQPDTSLTDVLAETESAMIRRVLAACDGQITASADVLGLTRQGLYKKMKRLNIDASNFQKQRASA